MTSIAGARLTYGALVDAELVVKAMEQYGRAAIIGTADRPFERHQAMWETQRISLARVLNHVDYQLVQSAFNNLKHMDAVFERARAEDDDERALALLLNDPH